MAPWLVMVTITTPIVAFFASFGSKAGADAYALVKQLVKDVWAARRDARGSVVLQDSLDNQVVFPSSLSEEALDGLRQVDWAEQKGAYLVWSEKERQWLDPLQHPSAF